MEFLSLNLEKRGVDRYWTQLKATCPHRIQPNAYKKYLSKTAGVILILLGVISFLIFLDFVSIGAIIASNQSRTSLNLDFTALNVDRYQLPNFFGFKIPVLWAGAGTFGRSGSRSWSR
jgi:hypothetical protein